MSMSFLPNPVIGAPRIADDRDVPAPAPPSRGGDISSELPSSDSVPAGRQIAGEAQPGAVTLTHGSSHAGAWCRAAQLFTYAGEFLVALGIVASPFWLFPLLKLLVGWTG